MAAAAGIRVSLSSFVHFTPSLFHSPFDAAISDGGAVRFHSWKRRDCSPDLNWDLGNTKPGFSLLKRNYFSVQSGSLMGNKIGRRRQAVDDKYTRPQGLYQHQCIDRKKLRKLILDSKLTPCYLGDEDCALDLEECPICFLSVFCR